MADITKCYGYFLEPPIKDGKCDMYWGENAEFIWNQLNDITNGKA
jgi:hypothetical protein